MAAYFMAWFLFKRNFWLPQPPGTVRVSHLHLDGLHGAQPPSIATDGTSWGQRGAVLSHARARTQRVVVAAAAAGPRTRSLTPGERRFIRATSSGRR